ncbi:MAG: metallophosphoesterase [Bacteroidales bacterium]|nr:metallophosphoesterase [Bacteroidales bacterium]
MQKKFVIGDIHGTYRALVQCMQRSGFDYHNDLLICMGDACDRWPETYLVIEELLKVRHLVFIIGNHDQWALKWFESGNIPYGWLTQGGGETIKSYSGKVPGSHIEFYHKAVLYHLDENRIFVHGGIKPDCSLKDMDEETFIWDRELVNRAMINKQFGKERKLTSFDEVYVGHTPTIRFGYQTPVKACEVWMMDTGAGWNGGYLSIMNIETKEYFQSDEVMSLYEEQ